MAYSEIPHRKGWTKAPSAIRSPLGPIFFPIHKANTIADRRQHVEAQVKALLATADEDTPDNF
jgi:hypothetical protein